MGFSFEMGDEELRLMTTGRFLGEDERSLSGFGVKQTTTNLYTVTVQHGDLVTMLDSPGRSFWSYRRG